MRLIQNLFLLSTISLSCWGALEATPMKNSALSVGAGIGFSTRDEQAATFTVNFSHRIAATSVFLGLTSGFLLQEEATIGATTSTYLSIVPVELTAYYRFLEDSFAQPYAGFSAGAAHVFSTDPRFSSGFHIGFFSKIGVNFRLSETCFLGVEPRFGKITDSRDWLFQPQAQWTFLL